MENNILIFCKKIKKLHLNNSIQNKISFGFCRSILNQEIPEIIIKICWLYALPADIFVLSFNSRGYIISPYSINNAFYSIHSVNVKIYQNFYLFKTKEIIMNTSLLNQHWSFKLDRYKFNTDILIGFMNWQTQYLIFSQKFSTYLSSSYSLITTKDIIHIYSITDKLELKIYYVINKKIQMIETIKKKKKEKYNLVVGLTSSLHSERKMINTTSISIINYNLFNDVNKLLKKFEGI